MLTAALLAVAMMCPRPGCPRRTHGHSVVPTNHTKPVRLKGDSVVGHVREPCGHDAQRNTPVAERQTWPASTYVSKTVELTAQHGVWLLGPEGETHQQAKLQQARRANSRALPYAAAPAVRRNILPT